MVSTSAPENPFSCAAFLCFSTANCAHLLALVKPLKRCYTNGVIQNKDSSAALR